MTVSLKEVTRETLRAVCKLDAGDGATQVSPNAVSIAEASFYDEAWFRAIYDDDALVGFVMLYDPTLAQAPDEPDFFLWRLMVDKAHQRRGFGHAAVNLLIDHVRTRPGAKKLLVSHASEVDALARFYGSFGFVYTGDVEGGEKVMVLDLSRRN